jgi:hypothetical protein
MESRKPNLHLLLPGFPVRFSLDGIQTHLIIVSALVIPTLVLPVVLLAPSTAGAAPAQAVEAPAEEQQDPGGEREPDGVADDSLATFDGVDPGLCKEEEREIEYERKEGNGGGKARYAGAAARHGHLAHMGEETKDG